jgi:hypothetical protein
MALSCSRASHVSWLSGRARGGLCHVYGSIGYQVMIATPVQVLVRATRQVATPKPAFTPKDQGRQFPCLLNGPAAGFDLGAARGNLYAAVERPQK